MHFRASYKRLNISKLLKQIFHNKRHLTKYTSKTTSKTLDFLSDVHKAKYKRRNSPENRRSSEAIQVRMDMSHMRILNEIKFIITIRLYIDNKSHNRTEKKKQRAKID